MTEQRLYDKHGFYEVLDSTTGPEVKRLIQNGSITKDEAIKVVEQEAKRAMEATVIPWIKTRTTIAVCIGVACLAVLPALGIAAVLFAWAWSMVR